MIAVHRKQWEEAFVNFAETARAVEALGARWFQAQNLLQWAEAHLTRGEPADCDRARELLQECESVIAPMNNPHLSARLQTLFEKI